jgi:hypothetical protein
VALGLLAGMALTAPPAQAVDAVGPYYAEPAWDQSLPVATRFVVLTNWNSKAVLDKETGLVWEKSPDDSLLINWWGARDACKDLTTGNRRGWRLPSIHELTSLIDPTVAPPGPTLPPGHPFGFVFMADYWSATSNAADLTLGWYVGFDDAVVAGNAPKGNLGHVWCVRGPMQEVGY